MDDDEFSRHQNSPQWRTRQLARETRLERAQRTVNNSYDTAIRTAQKRFEAAIAKASQKRNEALDKIMDDDCDRKNQDIREVAVALGIWHWPTNH